MGFFSTLLLILIVLSLFGLIQLPWLAVLSAIGIGLVCRLVFLGWRSY